MTTENRRTSRISFKPRAVLAAFGLALALSASTANAGPIPRLSSATLSTGVDDQANDIARDGAGSLFVVGYSSAGAQGKDIWVSRWDEASLAVISSMTFNGTANGGDSAQGVAVDSSGNVFVMGISSEAGQGPSLWMGKFTNTLAFVSSAAYAIPLFPFPNTPTGMAFAPGGDIVIANNTTVVGGNTHVLLARISPSLTLVSSATFFNGFNQNNAYAITIDPSGNIYMGGGVAPAPATSFNIWLGKFNSSLVFVASAAVAGAGGNSDAALGIAMGSDGNVYASGFINNTGAVTALWIAKYSPGLALLNSASYASPALGSASGDALIATSDRLYMAGRVNESVGGANSWIGELNYSLNLLSSGTYTSPGATTDSNLGMTIDTVTGHAFVAGYVTPAIPQIWVAKYQLPGYASYPGCAATNDVGAGYPFATIQSAVDALPSVLTGPGCVVIRDGATYPEQVTVQGFTNNGSSITIFADPASGLRPVVSPPAASTAAFLISNASVNVQGIDVVAAQSVPYGVWATSPYVRLSSLSVSGLGTIYAAGVRLGSWNAVSSAAVSVGDAHGFWLASSVNTSIVDSTATAASTVFYPLYLQGGGSNTVTGSYLANPNGVAAELLVSGNNTLGFSTLYSNNAGYYALYFDGAAGNTATGLTVMNPAGNGVAVYSGSDFNTISMSTVVSNGANGQAINITGSDNNLVTGSYVQHLSGWGVYLNVGADYNTVSLSTLVVASAARNGLYINASSFNTITQSLISNGAGVAALLVNSANYNTISQSSMTSNAASQAALSLSGASSNTITQSYISNPEGFGAYLLDSGYNTINESKIQSSTPTAQALKISATGPNQAVYNLISRSDVFNAAGHAGMISFGADHNDVFQSTFASNSSIHRALELNTVSSITISQSYMSNASGYALMVSFSTGVSIDDSRMESSTGFGLFVDVSSGVTAKGAYAYGDPAAYIRSSTRTALSGTLATFASGRGLWVAGGNVGFTASSVSITGVSAADGILLDAGNTGLLSFSSITVSGPSSGFSLWGQAPGAILSVSSATFKNLNGAATAVNFLGGTFVSTFAGVNFADGSILVNVNGAPLGGGSRITMLGASGPRAGPASENDPGSFVDWPGFGVAGVTPLAYTGVSAGGFTANWSSTLPGGTVFYLKLSTDSFATINSTHSTTNTNFNFPGLTPAFSYNVRLSTLPGGAFLSLGPITTPGGGGGAVNFNFFNNGNASVIASANGQNEAGLNVLADTDSPGGPFSFVIFASTPGATASRNNGHDTAGVVGLVKYGPSGNIISSRTLAIDSDGTMTRDASGNVYVGEMDKSAGPNSRKISKYGPSLNPLLGVVLSSASVGSFGAMVSDGSNIYAMLEDRNDNTAKLVLFDGNLTALATAAPYGFGPGLPVRAHGITGDGGGYGYVLVSSDAPNAPLHLLKYPISTAGALNGAPPAGDLVIADAVTRSNARVTMSAGMIYVAFPSADGASVFVRQFDPAMNYTGVSSTITNTSAPFGKARVAVEGDNMSVFVAATGDGGGGGDYLVNRYAAPGLAFISSAAFNGSSFLADQALGLAVGFTGEVYVTGASSDTSLNANALSVRLMMGGAAGGCGPSILFPDSITAVSTHSMTFNWTPDGCPPSTVYTAFISSDAFTTVAATVTTSYPFASFSNLEPGTAYMAFVSTTGLLTGAVTVGGASTFGGATLSISGDVGYAGMQTGGIVVEAFTTAAMTGLPAVSQKLPDGALQAYYLPTGAGTFYLRTFLDILGDGVIKPGADKATAGPITVAGSSVTNQGFTIAVDSIAPSGVVGVGVNPSAGQIYLSWFAPTTNVDGTGLVDLSGFIVERSTGGSFTPLAGSPQYPLPGGNLSFTDYFPVPGVVNSYRVIAVDFGQNASAPSAPASVAAGGSVSGGTISGSIRSHTVTVSGTYRVRLFDAAGAFVAESNQNPFSFSGLSTGTYFLKGFRDLDEDGTQGTFEPAGTAGGLHQNPFPIFISGTNSPIMDVTVCDRALLQVGPSVSGALQPTGCPALDAGPNRRSNLLAFEAGTGAAGSVSTGTALAISMTRIASGPGFFDSRLIVLGPNGQLVASNSSPEGASVSFTPVDFGVYVVEPTSQFELSSGEYGVTMSAGASGAANEGISGSVAYAGSQGGSNVLRFFSNSTFTGIPLATFTVAGDGAFDRRNLPAGTYTVDAFRDTGSGGFNPAFQAYGKCNGGSPVALPGGTVEAIGLCTLNDPASGTGGTTGTSSLSGSLLYNGGLTGTVRTGLYPYGSNAPVRFESSALAASVPFNFGSISSGTYVVKSFLDANANFMPDSNEPVVTSTSTGFFLEENVNRSGANFTLCDRAPIFPGTPVTFALSSNCPAPDHAGSYMKLYTFQGQSGQPVTLQADAINFSDSYLYLYDPNGNLIAVNDDGGGSYNAKLSEFPLPLNGLYTVGAGPYGSDVSGSIELSVTLSGGALGSISGIVDYTGTQGGSIQVAVFNSPNFDGSSFIAGRVLTSTRVFQFPDLFTGTTYYLGAFIDVNSNDNPDPGEDGGIFGIGNTASPIYLLAGQNVTGAAIQIGASTTTAAGASHVTGGVFYSGSRTGAVILEFWPGAQFMGSPIAVRNIPTGIVGSTATYDVTLAGGANYFMRAFVDVNGDFMPNPDEPKGVYAPNGTGAEALFVPTAQTLTGVNIQLRDPGFSATGVTAGEGSATLSPSALTPGQPAFLTVIYTAGPSGITNGGTIGFSAPNGFPFPEQSYSSVTVRSTATWTYNVNYGGPSAFVNVTGGSVLAGQQVELEWSNFYVPCAVGVQTVTVSAVQGAGAPPAPLFGGSPAVSIAAGAPRFFQPRNPYFSLRQGELSEAQVLEAKDSCGNGVPLVAGSTVSLHSAMWSPVAANFVANPDINLTGAVDASTTSNLDLYFAAGVSTRAFYVVGTSTGFHNLQAFFDLGFPNTYYYGLSVVPANALTAVSVSSSTSGQALSSTTISAAAATGVINPVFVNFTLGDPNQSWRVLFSSVPYRAGVDPMPVWERWGFGQPSPSEIVWDGRFSPWINGGVRVPNGLYYGRVELGGGGVRNESIRVTVALPQFAGRAYDSGTTPNPPLSSVGLRVYGPSGFYTATTGADGRYAIPGLGAGVYRLNLSREDYVEGYVDMTLNAAGAATAFTPRTAGVLVSSNATGGLDLFIGRSPRLIVVPSLDASILPAEIVSEQWGNLQVRPSTATNQQSTFYGPMRLQANTTTFDDGGQWDSGTQQFVARTLLGFNVPVGTYTVVADLNGYSRSTGTVYVGADGARLNLSPFVRKSVVTGQVGLGAGNALPYGVGVGITAIPLATGTAAAGLSGGAFINAGSTYAVYSISGFDAGNYLLRANTQGLSAVTTGPITVLGTSVLAGIDFPNFGAGASIQGVITAVGAPDGKRIWVNAWSPGSFNFGSTVVYTSGGAAPYELKGLDAGANYQLYANIDGGGGGDYDLLSPEGGFPLAVVPPNVAMNFTLAPASGVVSGTILLPPGSNDFLNVTLIGHTIASLKPDQVGKTFVEVSTTLPNFSCGGVAASNPSSSPVAGYCVGVTSATFLVRGVNTETIDIRFLHSTTGQSSRQTLSILNGSTSTLIADLRSSTYSISGSLINQITDTQFNTNEKVVANAPYIAPLNYPLGLSSTTARVTAVRQEIDSYGTAISTVFNPVSSRVGFLHASGTFTISNIPNGVYIVRTTDLRSCATCAIIAPAVARTVTVSGADVSSVTLTLSNGYSVSGTISLDGGLLDSRVFDLRILNRRQEVVRSTVAYLGNADLGQTAGSVDYSFTNLPAGEFYTLTVRGQLYPIKYAGRPLKFPDAALSPTGLQSNLTGQNVLMQRAAYLTGRLKDGGTGEMIAAANAALLAPNFAITAIANPWIEGGFVTAASSVSGRPVEGDGYFRVGPLVPEVSYDLRLAQTAWDPNFLASGSQNYAPVTIGGLKPTAGEIRDVGVISLGQGRSFTGVVSSTATGLALGNIKVTARPSFGGDETLVVQTFTNQQGRYSLWVSTAVSNQFSFTAAPRDGNQASDGRYYGTVVLNNVNLQTQTTANFLLSPLAVVVTGQIVVGDAATGGALSYPFGDKRGFPAAAVNLQAAGVVSDDPLGDIEATTDQGGLFSVPGLSTGLYKLHATSLGYAVYNATVQVLGANFRIFTGSNTPSNDLPGGVITLTRGATATGRILKSDGTSPNSSEVVGIAAANFAAGEFVVGSVETDAVAKTVSAYTISGFKTGISYNIVLLSGSNGKEVSFPSEGAGVVFAAAESTATKTINLTYRPASLDCLGTAKALDAARTQFLVQIDCLKPLRQATAADDDLTTILTVSTYTAAGAALAAPNGAGVLNNPSNSTNRRRLTATYTLATNETRFSMRIRASAAEVDPTTGDNFAIDKVFDFYAGLDSSADGRATNIDGGSVGMSPSAQDELLGLDERSRIDLPPGAFAEGSDSLSDSQAVAHTTTTVNISMTKGRDQALAKALSIASVGYAPAALQVADVPSAFPAEMWAAMSQYRSAASTSTVGGANPISAFYSIFLPAGIRHQLKQRADLTLSYNLATSSGTTDDKIQIWFYNAVLGRFVPETTNRRLDTVNKTVTVSVDHFSTFVVLDSTPVATSSVSFAGADIVVANFPNPADCITHSNIARNSTLFGSGGVHAPFVGTMIRTSIPNTGTTADLKINIYTVTGEKVRTIQQGAVPVGQTYYTPWDCRNEGGRTVASGVYIGEAVHGGRHRFFKIAIIKGSGL